MIGLKDDRFCVSIWILALLESKILMVIKTTLSFHMCCASSGFFFTKFYRCVWYVYTLRVFSVRCSISTTANKREYIKKMNASLPVVRKCHRDLSFVNATDALPSSVRMCNSAYLYSARMQQTPSQNRYTKPAARLSVHTHSQWRVAIWLYIKRKK